MSELTEFEMGDLSVENQIRMMARYDFSQGYGECPFAHGSEAAQIWRDEYQAASFNAPVRKPQSPPEKGQMVLFV